MVMSEQEPIMEVQERVSVEFHDVIDSIVFHDKRGKVQEGL